MRELPSDENIFAQRQDSFFIRVCFTSVDIELKFFSPGYIISPRNPENNNLNKNNTRREAWKEEGVASQDKNEKSFTKVER